MAGGAGRPKLTWKKLTEHSSGAVRIACDIQIDGRRRAGRPMMTWKKLTEKDCHEWKLKQLTLKKGAPRDQV